VKECITDCMTVGERVEWARDGDEGECRIPIREMRGTITRRLLPRYM
jgi:hypothetical protein